MNDPSPASADPPVPIRVPPEEIARRNRAVQAALRQADIEALFVVQRVDLYYLSGTAQNAFLYLPAEGDPLLFVKQSLPRAQRESAIERIVAIDSVTAVPGLVADFCGRLPRRLAFELDVLPVNEFRFYRKLFGRPACLDGAPLILDARRVKSDWEIARLAEAAGMTREVFAHMRSVIRPGLTEMEFAGLFEAHARRIGHGGMLRVRSPRTEGYPWHVLSGESGGMTGLLDAPASGAGTSAAFPVGAGYRRMRADEPVMVDMASVMNGYHLDETRMFAIGSMPPKALAASRAAIEIHDTLIEEARPGASLADLFMRAEKAADAMGLADAFLGPVGCKTRFIGHGIGLELIEPPFIARGKEEVLEEGMVFALEPKMVYVNEFAAGIESVFRVTPGGGRLISRVPVEIFVC